jgi:hypothetical protein
LGGAGVSSASKLKGSDPSLNNNEVTPPKVAEPEIISPWTKYTDMAMYGMLAAAVLIFIANALAKKAKLLCSTPGSFAAGMAMYGYAKIVAGLAMAAAAVVIFAGLKLKMGDPDGNPPWTGQKWTGIMYMAAGGMLMLKAYQALPPSSERAPRMRVLLPKQGQSSPLSRWRRTRQRRWRPIRMVRSTRQYTNKRVFGLDRG